jgi:hypothetical protein
MVQQFASKHRKQNITDLTNFAQGGLSKTRGQKKSLLFIATGPTRT